VGSVCKGGASPVRVARPLAMTKDAHTRAARRWGVMSTPCVGLTQWVAVMEESISSASVCPPTIPFVFVTCPRRAKLIGISGENRGTVIWEQKYKDLDLLPSCCCWCRSHWAAYSERGEGVVRRHIRPVPFD